LDWKLALETYRESRAGAPLGDVAVMERAAQRRPSPAINDQLERVRAYAPEVSSDSLRSLPKGSLGGEYAHMLLLNKLEHLSISEPVLKRFADNPYAIRYTVTHDLHHVLTGFDTGLAGEVGVVGFTVGQGTAPLSASGMQLFRWLYVLMSPSQARATLHNYGLGVRMGERAKLVLAEPLESWLEQPLALVRKRLSIREEDIAEVYASGSSWLFRIYGATVAPAAD
jgi:ubiquinone biosynthesis protein COQ4